MCEKFHYDNDFKLNLLKNFFGDHMMKHIADYESCWTNEDFKRSTSVAEKDRKFVDCHNRWIDNLRNNVAFELELRARELFQ